MVPDHGRWIEKSFKSIIMKTRKKMNHDKQISKDKKYTSIMLIW